MSLMTVAGLQVDIAGKTVCDSLDFTIDAGEIWGILGANGSGKTTLLHTLAGLRRPAAGSITLEQRPLQDWPRRARARYLALLTQDQHDHFPSTLLETALAGRHPHLSPWSAESTVDLAIAHAALSAVDLAGQEHRAVSSLSGGERQRLALATLRCQQARLSLLDEPTNHLDLGHRVRLLATLCDETRSNGGALLMSLHDLNLAARFCDKLILLCGEGITAVGPTADLMQPETLSALYAHPIVQLDHGEGRVFVPE